MQCSTRNQSRRTAGPAPGGGPRRQPLGRVTKVTDDEFEGLGVGGFLGRQVAILMWVAASEGRLVALLRWFRALGEAAESAPAAEGGR